MTAVDSYAYKKASCEDAFFMHTGVQVKTSGAAGRESLPCPIAVRIRKFAAGSVDICSLILQSHYIENMACVIGK